MSLMSLSLANRFGMISLLGVERSLVFSNILVECKDKCTVHTVNLLQEVKNLPLEEEFLSRGMSPLQ